MQSKEGIATCAFIAHRPTTVQFPRDGWGGEAGGGRTKRTRNTAYLSMLLKSYLIYFFKLMHGTEL